MAGLNISRVNAQSTTLNIDPSIVTETPSAVNSAFTVTVDIGSVSDLFGFDISITWDNSLITFQSLNNATLNTIWPNGFFEPLSVGYQNGAGYVRFAAVAEGAGNGFTGSGTLFTITFNIVKADNFPLSTPIAFGNVELSDSQGNQILSTNTGATYSMSAIVPELYFNLYDPNTNKPYEWGKYFEVQVYATDIVSSLNGYDLKVDYNPGLLQFVQVQTWGALGTGTSTTSAGVVEVLLSGSSTVTGNDILLFTLTFLIYFTASSATIWNKMSPQTIPTTVSLDTTYGDLSFTEGTLNVNGQITTTAATASITVHLIQGDVNCDGRVDVLDLRTVAAFYDKTSTTDPDWSSISMYDLNGDGTIDIYDLVLVAANFGYYIPDSLPT
jgi:hypothetical protein